MKNIEQCGKNCLFCQTTYCSIKAQECIKAINAILKGEKTLKQVNKEMAEKFEDWKDFSELQRRRYYVTRIK